jgi:hypothetical protein
MSLKQKKIQILVIVLVFIALGFIAKPSAFASLSRFMRRTYTMAAVSKEQVKFNAKVKATTKGKPATGISMRYMVPNSQSILFIGRLLVQGKITPDVAGSPLPSQIEISINHKTASGQIETLNKFKTNVQSTGAILLQNSAFSNFDLVNTNEVLDLAVTPIDKNLPACTLSLSVSHTWGGSAGKAELEQFDESAVAPQAVFIFNGHFIDTREKGKSLGPFLLKTTTQPGFQMNGTARVQARFEPDPAGVTFPNTIRVTVKHKNQKNGALIRTETFNVKMQPDGRVLQQSFPFTTQNATNTPESLELTYTPVERAFPESYAYVTFAYTPATTP